MNTQCAGNGLLTRVCCGNFASNIVVCYSRSGTSWSTYGSTLSGPASSEFGSTISMSLDGNRLAVGAHLYQSSAGIAYSYDCSSGTGCTLDQTFTAASYTLDPNAAPYFGHAVAVSPDGLKLSISAIYDENNVGSVWTFTRSGGTWTSGVKMIGQVANWQIGSSICKSYNGTYDLIGRSGYGYHVLGGAITLAAGVFERDLALPTQLSYSYAGTSCALDSTGKTLVVGGYGDNNNKGAIWITSRL